MSASDLGWRAEGVEVVQLAPRDQRDLIQVDSAWDPFSGCEALWHACPAHVWRRFEFDLNRGQGQPRMMLVTRCDRCGAARCDSYCADAYRCQGYLIEWENLDDHERQLYRCTLERHHADHGDLGGHDFLVEAAA